jgi:spermidine synthase
MTTPSEPASVATAPRPPLTGSSRALAFALGLAALGGQVGWMRISAAAVGGTVASAAIVLSAAMLGLSSGAWLAARGLARAEPRAILRALVLACAVVLALMPWVLVQVAALEGSLALRRVLAGALLALGHAPFGAVLPALAEGRRGAPEGMASAAGDLYGFSALGSATGAILVGEVLAPRMPLDWMGVALGALCLPTLALLPAPSGGGFQREEGGAGVCGGMGKPSALAFGMGALSVAAELLWARILGFHWESSTRTYALVVAGHIGGLAAGSFLGGRVAASRAAGLAPLSAAWVVTGLALASAAGLSGNSAAASTSGGRALAAGLLVGVPAGLSAAAFVLLVGWGGLADGRALALVLGWNSAGSAAGPLALWAALSWIGWPARTMVLLSAGYGLLVAVALLPRARWMAAALLAAGAAGLLGWHLAPEGPSLRGWLAPGEEPDFNAVAFPFARPGRDASVAVTRQTDSGVETLWIDRAVQGDTSALGGRIQKRLGRFPCELLGRPPRRALLIGLGTGITGSAVVEWGAGSLEVAELSEGVIEAASTTLSEANGRLAAREQVRVHHADGRSFLADERTPCDLIVVDLVFPSSPGAGNLFSREFYVRARRRLAPDGVFFHWLPCFQLSREDLSAVVAAFREGFPEGSAWIGFLGPRRLILGLAGGAIPRPAPGGSWRALALAPSQLGVLAGSAAPIRDADPRLEYRSRPREDNLYGIRNLERLMELMQDSDPPEGWVPSGERAEWEEVRRAWRLFAEAGLEDLRAESAPAGSSERERALEREESLYRRAAGRLEDAVFFLQERAFDRLFERAYGAAARGDRAAFLEALRRAAEDPLRGAANARLAVELGHEGRTADAVREFERAALKHPKAADLFMNWALVAFNQRDLAGARRAFERACALRPDRPPLYRRFAETVK